MANSKRKLTKWEEERVQAFKRVIERERAEGDKFFLNGIISAFPVEERLEGLKPEEEEVLLKLLLERQAQTNKSDADKS